MVDWHLGIELECWISGDASEFTCARVDVSCFSEFC